jgi:hypothetical protein
VISWHKQGSLDIPFSVTSSPGRITPWISVPASLLVWILLLALDLKVMLGAGLTGGWILAGVMFTFSALFIIWMVSEVVSAVHTRLVTHESMRGVRSAPRIRVQAEAMTGWLAGKDRFDWTSVERQRSMLGLQPCHARPNRMRKRAEEACKPAFPVLGKGCEG